jgi:hypothetical protein
MVSRTVALAVTVATLSAFAGAVGVSVALTALSTRVGDAQFDLDRLATEVRSLDARAAADGGTPTADDEGGDRR